MGMKYLFGVNIALYMFYFATCCTNKKHVWLNVFEIHKQQLHYYFELFMFEISLYIVWVKQIIISMERVFSFLFFAFV